MPIDRKNMQTRFIQVKYRLVIISRMVTTKITAVKEEMLNDHMSTFRPVEDIKPFLKMNRGTTKTTTLCKTPKKSHSRKV
jgi:hypothetical protein